MEALDDTDCSIAGSTRTERLGEMMENVEVDGLFIQLTANKGKHLERLLGAS